MRLAWIRPAIGVMLIDSSGEASRRAALRLVKLLGEVSACWAVRIVEYPQHEGVLVDLGLVA